MEIAFMLDWFRVPHVVFTFVVETNVKVVVVNCSLSINTFSFFVYSQTDGVTKSYEHKFTLCILIIYIHATQRLTKLTP